MGNIPVKDRASNYIFFNNKEFKILLLLFIAFFAVVLTRVFSEDIKLFYNPQIHLPLHITMEFLSIIISLFIAIQGWLIFPYRISNKRLLLSVLFLAVGLIDFFHMISYEGMPVFITQSSVSKTTWFWIMARLTESLGIFFIITKVDFLIGNNKRIKYYFLLSLVYVFIVSFIIFRWESSLPVLVVNNLGVTPLKKGLEYFISMIHLLTIFNFLKYYRKNPKSSYLDLILALGFLLLSELIFTLYKNVYDFDNFLGHVYKVIGYFYLLRGIYITTIEEPFKQKEAAEREKYRTQLQINSIIEKVSGAFISVDKNLNITYVNSTAAQILGSKAQNLLGKNLRSIHMDNNELSLLTTAIETRKIYSKKKMNISNKIIQADVIPLIDPHNKETVGASSFFIEVTEEEREKKQKDLLLNQYLRQTKNLKLLLDSLPVGILAIDSNERIVGINQELIKFFDPTIEDNFLDKSLQFLFERLNIDIPYSNSNLLRALNGEKIKEKVQLIANKIFLLNAYPIYDDNNKIIGSIGVYQNITELERLRNEISNMDRLKIVGEMAASITHEIRNPMAAIRGFVQLMQQQKEGIPEEYYKVIIDELDRANHIISDFLSLSKSRIIEKKELNLNLIIKDILPIIQAETNLNGQFVEIVLNEIPNLMLNENEIKQLIFNLARNGIEAMSKGGKLLVTTSYQKDKVQLEIKDNGIGIPKEKLEKIFDPFYTTKGNGTGLGLAVCMSIAEKYNGFIKVNSIEGVGTNFKVSFKPDNRS